MNRAIFLDRDGVLNEDIDLLTRPDQLRILAAVPGALRRFHAAGFRLIVITNQTVIARGLITEVGLAEVHAALSRQLVELGAPTPDGYYACPHHPQASVPEYRAACDCRKPAPGLLLRAARDHDIDTTRSFMIGDRPTDILAGSRAGCRTVLVHTGCHEKPLITTHEKSLPEIRPDQVCADLEAAADWILRGQSE